MFVGLRNPRLLLNDGLSDRTAPRVPRATILCRLARRQMFALLRLKHSHSPHLVYTVLKTFSREPGSRGRGLSFAQPPRLRARRARCAPGSTAKITNLYSAGTD